MSTATETAPQKKRGRPRKNPDRHDHPGAAAVAPPAAEPTPEIERTPEPAEFTDDRLLLDDIAAVDGANPRRAFDDEGLAELAASIRQQGLLQPLVVRQVGTCYELVAGERRMRAARLAGLADVPVRIASLTDVQAAEIRLVENLQRQDLSPIEEAQGFQRLIAAHGHTQEALAQKLGRTQAFVANRLRLLKLPAAWRQRVISGEMPSAHARALVPYAELPAILEEVEELFFPARDGAFREPLGNDAQFAEDVRRIARNETRPMTGEEWAGRLGRAEPIFEPTEAQRKKLAIIDVGGEPWATNTKLWKELREKQIDALVEKRDAKGQGKKGGAATSGTAAAPKRTPAQEKASRKKQAGELERWIAEWRSNWLRYLLSRRVFDEAGLAAHVVLMFVAYGHNDGDGGRVVILEQLEAQSAGKLNGWDAASYRAIARAGVPAEIFIALAAAWLWDDDEGPRTVFGPDAVEALAEAAAIDLAAQWKQDLAGPLTEAFFNRHSRPQLEHLAVELTAQEATGQVTKRGMVDAIIADPVIRTALPASIKPVEAKGTKKRKTKKKAAGKKATKAKAAKKPVKRPAKKRRAKK